MSDEVFRPHNSNSNKPERNHNDVMKMQGRQMPTNDMVDGEGGTTNNMAKKIPPAFRKHLNDSGEKQEIQKDFTAQESSPLNPKQEAFDEIRNLIKEKVYSYEEIVLPSEGKFYGGSEAPVNGTLHVRGMTGKEENILATPRYSRKGDAIDMIFKNCVKETINPREMLSADRMYLLVYLKGISSGIMYDIQVPCNGCGNNFNYTVNLDADIKINYCPDDFDSNKLVITLPETGLKLKYRLQKGKDEVAVMNYRERKVKDFDGQGDDDTLIYRASLMIEEIITPSGKSFSGGGVKEILTELPIADIIHLRNEIENPPFGMNSNINVICPVCGNGFETGLAFDINFFYPKTKKTLTDQA